MKNIFFRKNLADIRVKFSCRHYHEKKIIHFHSPTRSNRSIEGRYFTPPLRPANIKCPSKGRKKIFSQFCSYSSKMSSRRTFLSSLVIIWSVGGNLQPQTCYPYIFSIFYSLKNWRHVEFRTFSTGVKQLVTQEFPFDLLFWNLSLCFIKGWTWFVCN